MNTCLQCQLRRRLCHLPQMQWSSENVADDGFHGKTLSCSPTLIRTVSSFSYLTKKQSTCYYPKNNLYVCHLSKNISLNQEKINVFRIKLKHNICSKHSFTHSIISNIKHFKIKHVHNQIVSESTMLKTKYFKIKHYQNWRFPEPTNSIIVCFKTIMLHK